MSPKVYIVFATIIFHDNTSNKSAFDNSGNPCVCICLAMTGHYQTHVPHWLTNGVNVMWPICHSSNLLISSSFLLIRRKLFLAYFFTMYVLPLCYVNKLTIETG